MDIQGYLTEIRALHASGQTTEHSFRPALARRFGSIAPDITVIDEPKHITRVGAPDFVFNGGEVAIGWCEAKDIGKDVRKFAANDYSKAQKDRYRKGLPNLIYTNGPEFCQVAQKQSLALKDRVTLPEHLEEFLERRIFVVAPPVEREIEPGGTAIIGDFEKFKAGPDRAVRCLGGEGDIAPDGHCADYALDAGVLENDMGAIAMRAEF